jgi:hypothetical protein
MIVRLGIQIKEKQNGSHSSFDFITLFSDTVTHRTGGKCRWQFSSEA